MLERDLEPDVDLEMEAFDTWIENNTLDEILDTATVVDLLQDFLYSDTHEQYLNTRRRGHELIWKAWKQYIQDMREP